jgi:hypothetical protein
LGRYYYFLRTRNRIKLFKRKRSSRKRGRSINLYERCIMELNRVAFSGRRMYKIKMRSKLRKEIKHNKSVDSIYPKRMKEHFDLNVLVRRHIFSKMINKIVKKQTYATNMLAYSRRISKRNVKHRKLKHAYSNSKKYKISNKHYKKYQDNRINKQNNKYKIIKKNANKYKRIKTNAHKKTRSIKNAKNDYNRHIRTNKNANKEKHLYKKVLKKKVFLSSYGLRMLWYKKRFHILKIIMNKRYGKIKSSYMHKMRMYSIYKYRRRHLGIFHDTKFDNAIFRVKHGIYRTLRLAYIFSKTSTRIRVFVRLYCSRATDEIDAYRRLIVSSHKVLPGFNIVIDIASGGAFTNIVNMNVVYNEALRNCEGYRMVRQLVHKYSWFLFLNSNESVTSSLILDRMTRSVPYVVKYI